MAIDGAEHSRHDDCSGDDSDMQKQMRFRFVAMILTGMVVMYAAMFRCRRHLYGPGRGRSPLDGRCRDLG